MTRREWNVWKWFILAEKKSHIRFVDYFTDRLVTLLQSKIHNPQREVCVKTTKLWLFIKGNVKEVVNLTRFLRQKKKKSNKQTNTKGYRVLDVMMCNPKGSLPLTNLWVRFCKEIIFLTQKLAQLTIWLGPLRRKYWPINIDFEQDAAKKFRKLYLFMHTYE